MTNTFFSRRIFLIKMDEHEPFVLRQARQIVDSLSEDFSVYDPSRDGIIPMPESLVPASEANSSLAQMVYPVCLFMLSESPIKLWSVSKIYQEFSEKYPDANRNEAVFKGAIAFLAVGLDQEELLDFVGDDHSLTSEQSEFSFKSNDEFQAKAHEYCADLGVSADAPEEEVIELLKVAENFRQKSEY